MSGTDAVWQLGYTGAGTRIAVIDTGLMLDHETFDPGAFDYAIAEDAQKAGMSVEDFIREKDLLDAAEIAQVLPQLNAHRRRPNITAEEFYASTKVPFGYNYIDNSLYVTHDEDMQGGHGSHVGRHRQRQPVHPRWRGRLPGSGFCHWRGRATPPILRSW